MMKNALRLLLPLIVAVPLFAGGLTKYKDWPSSPQGYFMTGAERTQWDAITSDDQAEKFVASFLARRGPTFVADVEKAAAMADKYLTVGKTAGSKTLRGKVVIVLGPPTAISVEQKALSGDRRMSAGAAEGVSGDGGGGRGGGGGGGQGASVGSMVEAANSSGMSGAGAVVPIYKLTYSAAKLPASHPKDLVVTLEVDPDGTDKIRDRKLASEVDSVFEAAAKAKIVSNQ